MVSVRMALTDTNLTPEASDEASELVGALDGLGLHVRLWGYQALSGYSACGVGGTATCFLTTSSNLSLLL